MKLKRSSLILLLILLCSTPNITAYAQNPNYNNTHKNEVALSNTHWVYKTENGKTYRRLYDHVANKWIGDWELC